MDPNSKKAKQKQPLVSEYDIQERPGMRATKISQKVRQEKDLANMTSEDEEYTKLVETINQYLKELFMY
jgi:2',3'-cyclic-nucleotide 2'-phosphodiesterase (5'-nucleotidase family)